MLQETVTACISTQLSTRPTSICIFHTNSGFNRHTRQPPSWSTGWHLVAHIKRKKKDLSFLISRMKVDRKNFIFKKWAWISYWWKDGVKKTKDSFKPHRHINWPTNRPNSTHIDMHMDGKWNSPLPFVIYLLCLRSRSCRRPAGTGTIPELLARRKGRSSESEMTKPSGPGSSHSMTSGSGRTGWESESRGMSCSGTCGGRTRSCGGMDDARRPHHSRQGTLRRRCGGGRPWQLCRRPCDEHRPPQPSPPPGVRLVDLRGPVWRWSVGAVIYGESMCVCDQWETMGALVVGEV